MLGHDPCPNIRIFFRKNMRNVFKMGFFLFHTWGWKVHQVGLIYTAEQSPSAEESCFCRCEEHSKLSRIER